MIKSRVFLKFITTYTIVLIIPILLISVLVYTSFVKSLKEELTDSTSRVLLQASDNMDKYLEDLNKISVNIPLNSTLAQVILAQNANNVGIYPIYQSMQELNNFLIPNSNLESIFLFLGDSDLVISDTSQYSFTDFFTRVYISNSVNSEELSSSLHNLKSPVLLGSQQVYKGGSMNDVISYIKPLPIYNHNSSISVGITIKKSAVYKMIHKALGDYEGFVYIFDEKNNIVLNTNLKNSTEDVSLNSDMARNAVESLGSNDKTIYGTEVDDFILSYVRSDTTGWKYVALIKSEQVLEKVEYIKKVYVYFSIIVLLIGLFFAFSFSKGNYSNVKKIEEVLLTDKNDIENNELGKRGYYKNEWALINSSIKRYITENESLHKKLADQLPTINNYFLTRLIRGEILNSEEINPLIDFLKLDIKYEYYSVILIKIDDYKLFVDNNLSETSQGKVCAIVAKMAEELCNRVAYGYSVEIDKDEIAVIVALTKNNGKVISETVKEIGQEIHSYIKENFSLEITVAISDIYDSFSDIPNACAEAKNVLDYKIIKSEEAVICFNELENRMYYQYSYSFKEETQIINYLRQGDFNKIKEILGDVISNIKNEPVTLEIAKCMYFEIINTAIKAANELGIDIRVENYLPEILKKQTIDDIYKEVCDLYEEMCNKIKMSMRYKNDDLKDNVIKYMSDNYSNKELSVEYIAKEFNVSLSYMSHFFNEQTGKSFVDYLHHLRLSKAKELLTFSKKSITEVAEEAGYNSVYNFTRVFKRYEKVTPTEFRQSMSNITRR